MKAGIWRRLQVRASSLPPLFFWAQPPALLCPASCFWVLQKLCNCCSWQPKFFGTFCIKHGNLTGKGRIQGSGFPDTYPQPWLPCSSPQWKRDRFVLLLGKSAFPPIWRGFSYLVFLGMPILETEIRRSPWFPTFPLRTWLQLVLAADMTWVSDVPNNMSVCARKILGSDEKEEMKAHESFSAFLVTTLFAPNCNSCSECFHKHICIAVCRVEVPLNMKLTVYLLKHPCVNHYNPYKSSCNQ